MLTLAELLHPITPDRFMADYHDRKPLHIPAGASSTKARIFDWDRLNGLLAQSAIWTAANLKLVRDGAPIPPDQYCTRVRTPTGEVQRPAPARVDVFLSTGASLIADDIQSLTPELAALADMLSRTFGASVGANAYASFGGVQAFGTHFDLHDVFAVHISGEKTWQLYESRADTPVTMPGGGDPRPYFQQTRGPLMQSVRMRPGDVLYLPRGWYHDALADGPVSGGNASLHVTFSVAALYGRIIFGLLETMAMQDPAFRAYMPPAQMDGGAALQRHLADLGQRLAALATSPGFRDTLAGKQAELAPRLPAYGLPVRKPLTLLRPTGAAPPAATGPLAEALQWAFSQPTFALEDLCAEFDTVDEAALRTAVAAAEADGALKRV